MDTHERTSSFEEYSSAFARTAFQAGRDEKFVAACLAYAGNLWRSNLPVIYDTTHLSGLVGYDLEYVTGAAYGGSRFYRSYQVNKKSGGVRQIDEPLPSLKEIQRWILDHVLSRVAVNEHAKGFRNGKSIKDAARFHRGQASLLTLDLQDFFPSIKRKRVFALFRGLGYGREVSNYLARLCCLNNALPQGAPTSPALSNIACRRFDARLAGFAVRHGLRYTRYADDLAFSGAFRPGDIIGLVRKVSVDEGFVVHPQKIRTMMPHQRQVVTGIVVNRKMQAPRDVRRMLRAAVHYIKEYGLESHLAHIGEQRANYLSHLIGLATFITFVNPADVSARTQLAFLRDQQRVIDS